MPDSLPEDDPVCACDALPRWSQRRLLPSSSADAPPPETAPSCMPSAARSAPSVPGSSTPRRRPPPEGTIRPRPGSWDAVHPPRGYRVVLLTAGDDPATTTLVTAVKQWAKAEHVRLKTVAVTEPDGFVDGIVEAMDLTARPCHLRRQRARRRPGPGHRESPRPAVPRRRRAAARAHRERHRRDLARSVVPRTRGPGHGLVVRPGRVHARACGRCHPSRRRERAERPHRHRDMARLSGAVEPSTLERPAHPRIRAKRSEASGRETPGMAETPPARRCVTIRTDVRAAAVELAVRDTGTGLPLHIEGKLFTPFVTTKAHGTGIGLTIARTIVDAHHGTIDAHNNPEGGATFTVTLPRNATSRSRSGPRSAA